MSATSPSSKVHALILAGPSRAQAAQKRYLGLTIIERIIKNLQSHGVSQITVADEADTVPKALHGALDFYGLANDSESLSAAYTDATRDGASLFVIPGDVIYHPKLLPRFLDHVAAADANADAQQAEHPRVLIASEDNDHAVLLIPPGALDDTALSDGSLAKVVTALAVREVLARIDIVQHWSQTQREALFIVPATTQGRHRARGLLMKLNWRPHDGLVAGLVNKHVSVPISLSLVNVDFITPNVMTGVAFVIALVGIGLTTLGTYSSFLIGAALVQIQSILDGCDGEIARLRYLTSRFGAWFDTVVDDTIGILWIIAVGIGMTRMTGQWGWLALGLTSTALYSIALGLLYYTLIRGHAQSHSDFVWFFDEGRDPHADYPDLKKISTWLTYIVRRDFYVLAFLILASANLMIVVAITSSLAATIWFIIGMIHFSKRGLKLPDHA